MLEMLKKSFSEKEARYQELVDQYNSKIESKKKIEAEMIEIEKEIIHNQGAMVALDEIAAQIMNEKPAQEIITSDTQAEVITTEA